MGPAKLCAFCGFVYLYVGISLAKPVQPDWNDLKLTDFDVLRWPADQKSDTRIVGGTIAVPHSWPWQVMLAHIDGNVARFLCGGVILNDRWILTAGHCCQPHTPDKLLTVVGDHDVTATNEPNQKTHTIEQLIMHPNYSQPVVYNHDLCLIKTRRAIEFNAHVRRICLHNATVEPSECYTSGWGSINRNPTQLVYPPQLRQVKLDITRHDSCKRIYGSAVTENMLCAMGAGRGSCIGDSGGPFMCKKAGTQQWELLGVTSFVAAAGCGHALYPSVYARVSTAAEWILQNTGAQPDCL